MTGKSTRTSRAAAGNLPRSIGRLILVIVTCSIPTVRVSSVARAQEAESTNASVTEEGPFGDFDDENEYPDPDQLKTILAEIPGQRHEITKRNRGRRPATLISGLFRLNLPWQADKALRLSLWDPDTFRLHLWNGRAGVTLRHHRHFYCTWAAYGTTREPGEPQPSTRALWATDNGRYRRVGVGTVEVHYREGHLTLTRGDLPLLCVPMAGPPTEVFFEGNGHVRGLAMVRSTLPDEPVRSRPGALDVGKPAEFEWDGDLPEGVSLNKLPDGPVELRADPRAKDAQTSTTLSGPGLHEITLHLEDPEPGAGVYFADRDGRPLIRLAFFRDRTTGESTFGLLHPSRREIDRSHDARHVVPFAGRRQWLRVILGAGVIKYWTSGDGVHWSRTAPAVLAVEGECRRIGLYTLAHDKPRAIKLRSIEVRRLEAMASLLPDTVRQQVDLLFEGERETFLKAGSLDAWEERVAELQTPDVEAEQWWCACSLATLAAGPNLTLGRPLLDGLIQRLLSETWQLEPGLQMLEEAALFCYSSDRQVAERLGSHYVQFGRRLARRGEPRPFTRISQAMMRAPLWTDGRIGVFSDHLLRHELFTLIDQERWPEVAGLSQRLTHWNQVQADSPPLGKHAAHLSAWAAAQAAGHVPADGRDAPAGVPLAWRHPLVERLSKEGYNVLAELNATLKARAFRDACQVISVSAGIETLGLLPDARDPRLWAPLPAAMESTMREYPALRETMQQEFGPLGKLRVKQAIAAGDVAAVELAALQFCGTNAARHAAAWLGDRSLASGRFAEAFEHYQNSLQDTPDEPPAGSIARLRIAGALTGRDVGSPIAFPVDVGGSRLDAKQFEQLLDELRRTHQAPHDSALAAAGGATSPTQAGFLPGRYTTHPWARVDGSRVQRPSAMPDRGLDWPGRQTAVLVTDRRFLVNNQVDQLAFDLATGSLVWAQCRAVESRYQQWPLVRMQPVLASGRVFVRQLADGGPELVSLEGATGRILWSGRPSDGHVASDPLFLGNHLFALTVGYHSGEKLALSLTRFDPHSGQVLRQTPLAEFRDVWRRQLPTQATVADGRIVATVGGCVLSCNASGHVSWLRRQIWVPRSGDSHSQAPDWFEQVHEAPLVRDGRIYATQPGVWAVECLHEDTGQLVWRQPVAGLTRPLGLASGRLIVQTRRGLLAMDPDSGKTLWDYASDHPPEARLCGQPDVILLYHLQENAESRERPQFALTWIDAETGLLRERSVLRAPESSGPWLGPLVAGGHRQWALVAAADDAKSREVIELKLDTQP